MLKDNENLISIDELIARAKNLGVDFGKGDPRNRLRYFVKIGLLPHAQRKSYNGLQSQGVYPESVLKTLLEIDRKIKEGKSILQIKRELEREREEKFLISEKRKAFPVFKKIFNFSFLSKTFFTFLIFFSLLILSKGKINFEKSINMLLATIANFKKIVQAPAIPEAKEEIPSLTFLEPFLTINAETVIKPKLTVEESIFSPSFVITKDGFSATISTLPLTGNRTINFPDQSGIVCLSTGNCVGLGGEVVAVAPTVNRLAKFVGTGRIYNSSIQDLFGGLSITIDPAGNVGIGTPTPRTKLEVAGNLFTTGRVGIGIENPLYSLHVLGQIQATGDICTDLAGGKCLSQISVTPPVFFGGGIGGSGTTNYIPIWTAGTTLGNSILYQSGDKLGIGTTAPTEKLEVVGTIKMTGFQLPTGAQQGYVLTSDAFGFGTWQPAPTGTLPLGIFGQTLRHDGSGWVPTDFLYNTGSAIGIGTTSTIATLTVAGSGFFEGPLTIQTSNLPQMILKYDNDHYLRFSISSTSSEIFSFDTLIFNSQTGELKFFDTSLKKGDKILRASIPIFKFPIASETSSTTFVALTKEISTTALNSVLPPQFEGSQRKFAFLINFADNIPTNASSSWRIDFTTQPDIDFEFQGQNLSQLNEGVPHLKDNVTGLLDDNWVLKAKIPDQNYKLRVFNIFLLVYDQIQ